MRILVLSDDSISTDKGGFSQTLYNVFSFINPDNFLFITSETKYEEYLSTEPFLTRTITYNFEVLRVQKNRFGKYINKFIHWLNYSINYNIRSFKKIKQSIEEFNPDKVIVAASEEESLVMYHRLKPAFKQIKVFPFFMDDWIRQSNYKWVGSNVNILARQLLAENRDWFMISKNLSHILSERYNVKPKRLLEIHNPVDVSEATNVYLPIDKDEYIFAYAGSIWQMHVDSLLSAAKAIKLLCNYKKSKLIIYTSAKHWRWRKQDFIPLGAEYGGSIPYKEIHQKLNAADFLLVTSTFTKDLFTHSKASIQTKITDYLKAGKPIISIGPSYSANHEFLKKYNCGICIETADEHAIAERLKKVIINVDENRLSVANGLKVLKEEFSFEKVHHKLKEFIQFSENVITQPLQQTVCI